MKNDAKTNYLLNGVTTNSFKDHFENNKIKTQEGECLIETLKRAFKEEIPCNLFYQAISGKGNESDKIDTIYSSSLQALLFFSQVSATNKITINGITYSKVKFEHQNTVIPNCDPSCIDVCLMDDKESNVLFIESKLFEIMDASSQEGKFAVGPSYLTQNGYGKLDLSMEDIIKLGIDCDGLITEDEFQKQDNHWVKQKLLDLRKNEKYKNRIDSNGKIRIKPIKDENEKKVAPFVYSEGIRQLLSHIIGIINYSEEREKKNLPEQHISFLTIFNRLDDKTFETQEWAKKKEAFINHYEAVIKKLNTKEPVKDILKLVDEKMNEKTKAFRFSIISYQDLYKSAEDYKLPKTVEQFYKLEQKE